MKPSVPETGTVIRLDGGKAVIMMKGGHSCKGCGAAKIGLCRAGNTSMFLTAGNALGAEVGDTVQVDLDKRTKIRGFSLAYIAPLFFFIAGALAGHMAGTYLSMPSLDIVTGFTMLLFASYISFKRLRKLDKSQQMVVKRIVSDHTFSDYAQSEEELRYLKYLG